MSKLQFVVPGSPVGKGRPRFRSFNGHVSTYTPKETQEAESRVKSAFLESGGKPFGDSPVGIEVVAYFPIPKSATRKAREAILAGAVKHTHTPDIDNILKLVCDAINGIAFNDDKQIVVCKAEKRYSDEPRTEVSLWNE